MRKVTALLLALLFIPMLGGRVQAANGGPAGLVGLSAMYDINSRHEMPNGSILIRDQRVKNTIIDQVGNMVIIESEVTENNKVENITYQVPIHVLQRPAPGHLATRGDRIQFTETHDFKLQDGTPSNTVVTGESISPWFKSVSSTVTGPLTGRFVLKVDLVEWNGSIKVDSTRGFLWLLPNLIPPNEGVEVIRSSVQATPSTGGTVTAQAAYNAYSKLTTIDNPTANITVWISDFSGQGLTTDGVFTTYYAYVDARATSPNWWLLGKSTAGSVGPAGAYVTVEGNSNFQGVFPLGPFVDWTGHAWHKHEIRQTGNRSWLQGLIMYFDPVSGNWLQWKQQNFYTGGTYPSGSRQDAVWYIVSY